MAHEDGGFRDRGLSGTLSWDPDPESDLGLSIDLAQTLGAQATGGMDALLNPDTTRVFGIDNTDKTENTSDEDLDRRLEANLGYGFAMFGDRYTGTPTLGLGLSEGGRDAALGWRLMETRNSGLVFGLDIEGRRSENDEDEPGRRFGFGFGWQLMGGRRDFLDFQIRFEGERLESADEESEHRFGVQMTAYW